MTFLRNTYDEGPGSWSSPTPSGRPRTLAFVDAAHTTTYTDTTAPSPSTGGTRAGQVTSPRRLDGSRHTTYDAEALPTTETDPLGRTRDAIRPLRPAGVANRSARQRGLDHVQRQGDQTSTTDAGGAAGATRTVSFDLNADGLPVTKTNPDGTQQRRTYDPPAI